MTTEKERERDLLEAKLEGKVEHRIRNASVESLLEVKLGSSNPVARTPTAPPLHHPIAQVERCIKEIGSQETEQRIGKNMSIHETCKLERML